ncbi:SGNH/GDSL hydrolase family protein [Endozoicomonas acroporae]|uniref:SGNH/GDSL hydrolase family protein n=1 Tax=Endozoicomonas acroporae TaxID=1701104 RepID=UPI000C765717|nr:SGNH/GDSL hydrolase family protein [Endozoicomonas acroporae]
MKTCWYTLIPCCLVLFSLQTSAHHEPNISSPVVIKPEPWSPHTLLVFGDSLSDSHGDDFHTPDSALSTFNLLKTLRGDFNPMVEEPPIDLSQFFSRASSIRNIKQTFALYRIELQAEKREQSFIRRLMTGLEEHAVNQLESLLTNILAGLEYMEQKLDSPLLGAVQRTTRFLRTIQHSYIARQMPSIKSISRLLANKTEALGEIIRSDLFSMIPAMAEETLLSTTSQFADQIPLLPDSQHYEEGKWTTGREMDLMWPEVLVRMMSYPNQHKVNLDNRAMAGSWILCAESKLGRPGAFLSSVEGVMDAVVTLFQGSLIPPCEGLIVQSYLNERNGKVGKDTSSPLILPDTLVVFFNGGNDFLNNWQEPDDIAQEQAQDIYNVLQAGAQRVIVFSLPDITSTPRFLNAPERQELHEKWRVYNASLSMRINLLRKAFPQHSGYRVMKIDGEEVFEVLRQDPQWDFVHPILNIPIPGIDDDGEVELDRRALIAQKRKEAEQQRNIITRELLNNAAFDDSWHPVRNHLSQIAPGKTAFYSDSVHPSAEAHYAIAEQVCQILEDRFNIPCDTSNYPEALAIKEAQDRKHQLVLSN